MQGFTLLEMLVVVTILAVIGGLAMSGFGTGSGSVQRNTKIQAARVEMEQIRRALLAYKRDVGRFPVLPAPAYMGFLFDQGSVPAWSPDYQTGWRGPYLSGGDGGEVDIGGELGSDGTGKPYNLGSPPVRHHVWGVPDPFSFVPVANNTAGSPFLSCAENVVNTLCLLDWRFVGQAETEAPHKTFGRPYLLFDLGDATKARIVSMGVNGVYDSGVLSCPATPVNDDLVLCLY